MGPFFWRRRFGTGEKWEKHGDLGGETMEKCMAKSPPNGWVLEFLSFLQEFTMKHEEDGALNWKKKMGIHHQTWGSQWDLSLGFHRIRADC